MKKSKMIELLRYYFERALNVSPNSKYANDLAISTLNFLEESGMSCPSYEGLLRDGTKYDKSNPEHHAKDTGCFNSWEPE